MNLKKGAKMSVENRLLPPKDVELADRTVKSIVDYQQGKGSSKCKKIAKYVGLLAVPIIAGSVSLWTRLEVCKDESSDECAQKHGYLHPVEVVGITYTVFISAAKTLQCCLNGY